MTGKQRSQTPKAMVRDGYDRVSMAYRADDVENDNAVFTKYREWIVELSLLLPPGSPVLDLGCGNGIPASALLVDAGFDLTGVDISPVQVARARQLVPEGRFIRGDMTVIDFPPGIYAAVVALYAVIHVPLPEQSELFAKIHTWIRPGGYLLMTVGAEAWTGVEENWLGVEGASMYWSHANAATYNKWLTDGGYSILWSRYIPEGDGGHVLILGQRLP